MAAEDRTLPGSRNGNGDPPGRGSNPEERSRAGEPVHGLKAHSRRGRIGRTWWSARWTEVLESFGLGDRLHRGRSIARAGHVLSLDIAPGIARAEVSGTRREVHDVRIEVEPITEEGWGRVQEILSRRALFAARLLAGEMPTEIEEAFAEAGLDLFPRSAEDVTSSCDCADPASPCPHAAAVFYLMAERFDQDPFQIFLLRGLGRTEFLESLKLRHGGKVASATEEPGPDTNGAGAAETPRGAEGDSAVEALSRDADALGAGADSADPLRGAGAAGAEAPVSRVDRPNRRSLEVPERYTDLGADLDALQPRIAPPAIPEAVLRRLGPPPGAAPGSAAEDALRRAYLLASKWALRMAVKEDGAEEA